MRNLELFYRTVQILHGATDELIKIVTPTVEIIASLIQIAVFFWFITFRHTVNHLTASLFLLVGITTFGLFFAIMKLMSRAGELSRKFPNVHSLLLSKKFRRSCAALRWKMGSFYFIKRNTYLIILKNIVLRSIVRLILTFDK